MALRRVGEHTKNPVSTVERAAGTRSDPVCSGASGSVCANTMESPVPMPPSKSDGMYPIKGSTSRRMATLRIARMSMSGIMMPLSTTAPPAISTACALNETCTSSVMHAENDSLHGRRLDECSPGCSFRAKGKSDQQTR